MNLNDQLDEALRLEAEATPGPWWDLCEPIRVPVVRDDGRRAFETINDAQVLVGDQDDRVCCCHDGECKPEANAKLIAAARNIPKPLGAAYKAALSALEASHAERDKLRFDIADNCCLLLGSHERMAEFRANPESAWDAVIAENDKLRAECNRLNRALADMAHDKGYAEGRAMGLEHELAAARRELAKREEK